MAKDTTSGSLDSQPLTHARLPDMVTIQDIMDVELLHQMVEEKYVRVQNHPSLPYQILNYTEKTQFDRVWNTVTKQCRGLIFNVGTGEVLARPFPKFFNYGEEMGQPHEQYRTSSVTVTDKLDGSLGILYPLVSRWGVATRGSFASIQAIHATELLDDYCSAGWEPPEGYTLLWEIIYPQNRIVVNYYDMDDLVLLGAVHTEHGYSVGPDSKELDNWPGPRATVFNFKTFEAALAAPERKGAEGLVVHFHQTDKRVKLKQADYIQLHRIVTGLNERRVWECMKDGMIPEDIIKPLPEEFHKWVKDVYNDIYNQWYDVYDAIIKAYDKIGETATRKDFALKAVGTPWQSALFLLYDNKDIGPYVWELIKPDFRQGPWSRGEDEA